MRCLCPKCSKNIEFDLTDLPEEGSFNKCPECNAGLLVKKVSFASRALHKGAEITCAECNSEPGVSIYCQKCHAIYPDFYITESSSAAKKQLDKILRIINRGNKLFAGTPSTATYTDYGIKASTKGKGIKLPSEPAQLIAIIAALVLVLGGGTFFWYQDRIETRYAENYVRVLYGIKAAADLDIKTCTRIATEWKSSMAPTPPPLSGNELTYLDRAHKSAESEIKKLGEPPKKFEASNAAISALFAVYTKIYAFSIKPTGSIESYATGLKSLDDEFKKSAGALKSGLPEKLSEQLDYSKKKYKALQDF